MKAPPQPCTQDKQLMMDGWLCYSTFSPRIMLWMIKVVSLSHILEEMKIIDTIKYEAIGSAEG